MQRCPATKNARFYTDIPASELAAQRDHFLPCGTGKGRRSQWLVLSSGGSGGAFGAGLLSGWSQRGDRPQFDLVTGVSAGALIAPFAFIGPQADGELATLFTADSVACLNQKGSLLAGILGQSAIPAAPLRALIDAHVTMRLIDRIAERHQTGARLLVVTTNLDAQRNVVWDIGAIAASHKPDRLRLIGDVLQASASIPAIFPPVRISVTGCSTAFEELHADGGAIRQLYLLPDAFLDDTCLGALRPDIHVVVNAEFAPSFAVIPLQSIRIAERALSSIEKSSAIRDVAEIAALAHRTKANFRLAYIDRTIPWNGRYPFDPGYMRIAYALGLAKGRAGDWKVDAPVGTGFLVNR